MHTLSITHAAVDAPSIMSLIQLIKRSLSFFLKENKSANKLLLALFSVGTTLGDRWEQNVMKWYERVNSQRILHMTVTV